MMNEIGAFGASDKMQYLSFIISHIHYFHIVVCLDTVYVYYCVIWLHRIGQLHIVAKSSHVLMLKLGGQRFSEWLYFRKFYSFSRFCTVIKFP